MNIAERTISLLDLSMSEDEFSSMVVTRIQERKVDISKFRVKFQEPFKFSFVFDPNNTEVIENEDFLLAAQALSEGDEDAIGVFVLDILYAVKGIGFDRRKHEAVTIAINPSSSTKILLN
jgi:hypothetical protein